MIDNFRLFIKGFYYIFLFEDLLKFDSNFVVNNLLKCLLLKYIVFLVCKIKKKEEYIFLDNKFYECMMYYIDGFSYIKVLKLIREII